MDRRVLLDLARRCEEATGPNFALERDIEAALGSGRSPPPNCTASLDAAASTVPPGVSWLVENMACYAGQPRAWIRVEQPKRRGRGAWAATPALALCAAALRARAAILRDQEIVLMEGARERHSRHLQTRLAQPEIRAALHRNDGRARASQVSPTPDTEG